MISHPTFEQVLEDLGDKVITGMGRAAQAARGDLLKYRRENPLWVADSTERGLANWIHDRLWTHLVGELDHLSEVYVHDKEPSRELWVGVRYRLRIKRHGQSGEISTYPTLAAMSFFTQGQEAFEGLEVIRLCAGYIWEKEERDMGEAVLSLRASRDKVIWCRPLPFAGEARTGGEVRPFPVTPTAEPKAPLIDFNRRLPGVADGNQNQEE
ncbi:hypothetical protein ACVMYR_02130 [Micromonospora sp. PTRAS2]